MRFLILISFLFFLPNAFAKKCEVFGISDSPQKLSCTFPGLSVNLSCRNGVYFLNSTRVNQAFHLEVEEGPTPLVFKTNDSELTVVIESKVDILAEIVRKGIRHNGTCL